MATRPSQPIDASMFVVERYWPHAPEAGLVEATVAFRNAAVEMAADGRPVRFVDAFLARQEEIVLTVFEADSAESVRRPASEPASHSTASRRSSGCQVPP